MSAETDIRALLAGYAPLAALVDEISLNAAPEGSSYPLVIYAVAHNRTYSLDGTLMTDQCVVTFECWAETAMSADAVADQVIAAVATAPLVNGAQVRERSTSADTEGGQDATVLTAEWWA